MIFREIDRKYNIDRMRITNDDIAFESGVVGIKFDFNFGARVQLPDSSYEVIFTDMGDGSPMEKEFYSDSVVCTKIKYCRPVRIRVLHNGREIWMHEFDLRGRNVRIELLMADRLGDITAFMPQIERFRQENQCDVYLTVTDKYADVFRAAFPHFHFINIPSVSDLNESILSKFPDYLYATYYYRTAYPDFWFHPKDIRQTGLQVNGAETLNVKPVLQYDNKLQPTAAELAERTVKEPYVCISLRASNYCKEWNNPTGWQEIVKYLKGIGYRVICIDGDPIDSVVNYGEIIAAGCEEDIGFKPLQERVDMLYHADFFIGLGSGLSWLAWATGTPVIMISGFSMPVSEFANPYRVINTDVCHGCWNNMEFQDQIMYIDCPFYSGTERSFECTKKISVAMVQNKIEQLMRDYHLQPTEGIVRC